MFAHLGLGAPSRYYPSSWRLLARLPHDTSAFTQGLAFFNGRLIESTGLFGASSLRVVALSARSYAVERARALAPTEFGEGVALWPPIAPETAIQLLWEGGVARVWALPALAPLPPLRFATPTGEGWGLAAVSHCALALSDGSSALLFVAPRGGALEEVAPRVRVTLPGGAPLERLNALAGAHGWVLANVWGSAGVAVVHARSGRCAAMLDFSELAAENVVKGDPDAVMNGLVYTAAPFCGLRGAAGREWGGVLLLTGKRWAFCYAVELCGLRDCFGNF